MENIIMQNCYSRQKRWTSFDYYTSLPNRFGVLNSWQIVYYLLYGVLVSGLKEKLGFVFFAKILLNIACSRNIRSYSCNIEISAHFSRICQMAFLSTLHGFATDISIVDKFLKRHTGCGAFAYSALWRVRILLVFISVLLFAPWWNQCITMRFK